ncbi:MAG: TauD/TfdA family dioxygenase, partial [Alphaproteobacteria bacterium]|nr:TauD/TfdA family dioxygenase [Alphaproteobacteria bacterium]
MSLKIEPLDGAFAAVVHGVALSGTLPDAVFEAIMAAWHEHAVLVFPGQHLDNETQAAFSRRIGPLENVSIFKNRGPDTPNGERLEFADITNRGSDGGLVAPGTSEKKLLEGNTFWHTDSSFKAVPAKASLLSARAVPSRGGETEYADMRAAYDALDADMKVWLENKTAIHSYAYSQGLVGGTELVVDFSLLPPVEHPLVLTHPVTGRKALYLGRHASHIVGEDEGESRALLNKLCEDACQAPLCYK